MKKIIQSIRKRPINLKLIGLVVILYLFNNNFLKISSDGHIQMFFICYFNDLICPLLFLSYVNVILLTADKEITHLWMVSIIIAFAGFIWEFLTPLMKSGSITDVFDIVCYEIGGLIYWMILKYIRE